jgi:ADP-ribosyl-[dinitrogen reductase] hydrolase
VRLSCDERQIGYLKLAFHWGFTYLKHDYRYYDAIKDILLKGGDTDTNAAIVGGLVGAKGIQDIPNGWI